MSEITLDTTLRELQQRIQEHGVPFTVSFVPHEKGVDTIVQGANRVGANQANGASNPAAALNDFLEGMRVYSLVVGGDAEPGIFTSYTTAKAAALTAVQHMFVEGEFDPGEVIMPQEYEEIAAWNEYWGSRQELDMIVVLRWHTLR